MNTFPEYLYWLSGILWIFLAWAYSPHHRSAKALLVTLGAYLVVLSFRWTMPSTLWSERKLYVMFGFLFALNLYLSKCPRRIEDDASHPKSK